MRTTKCLNSLMWYKNKINVYVLEELPDDTLGIIEFRDNKYIFIPVLYNGRKIKNKNIFL